MRKMIRKKKISQDLPFLSFLLALFVVFAIIVLAVSNIRIYEKRASLQSHLDEKEAELEILRERTNEAENLLNGTDDDFMIEKMAREQLLLKKPGEEVVFIVFPESDSAEVIEDGKNKFRWWNPFTWKKD